MKELADLPLEYSDTLEIIIEILYSMFVSPNMSIFLSQLLQWKIN